VAYSHPTLLWTHLHFPNTLSKTTRENIANFIWAQTLHVYPAWTQLQIIILLPCTKALFEGRVAIMMLKLTLPKLGLGSPPRLSKFQSSMVGVKTPYIGVFFISLENYWSVNVENGLARAIWTSIAQVMAKERVGSQTGSLTLNH